MSDIEEPLDDAPLDDAKVTQGRHRCIVLGILVVAVLAIAAIVLPLTLDDCDCPKVPGIRTSAPNAPPLVPDTPTKEPTDGPPEPPSPAPSLSPAPSAAPSTQRLGQFIEIFLVPISGAGAFDDTNSAQYRAAEFLADEDDVGPDLENTGQLADRYALATFYYAMDGDDSWTRCFQGDTECESGTAWMEPTVNHCEWNSIKCNEEGRVVDLFFVSAEGNGLKGSIPREFAIMDNLENFVAVNNNIQGKFPAEFGKMKNITNVILVGNKMVGTLPDDFLVDSPLALFLVSNNKFSGEIPASFGKIPTLIQLVLANNDFTGTIPEELGSAENLATLDLSGNSRIRGAIPDEIYGMTNLENLYLNGCANMQGTIDAKIGDMTSLVAIRLGGTKMSGSLPAGLFTLPNLGEIDLTNADFTGTLSEDFGMLGDTLSILKLSGNAFTGSIPVAFNSMALNILKLEKNDLTGIIPLALCIQRGEGKNQLTELTVDCAEVTCSCCTNNCA